MTGARLALLGPRREICTEEYLTVWTTGPEFDLTPTPDEVEAIACLLEGNHGELAANVADFIATQHSLDGDAVRSWAWTSVVDCIRERESERLRNT